MGVPLLRAPYFCLISSRREQRREKEIVNENHRSPGRDAQRMSPSPVQEKRNDRPPYDQTREKAENNNAPAFLDTVHRAGENDAKRAIHAGVNQDDRKTAGAHSYKQFSTAEDRGDDTHHDKYRDTPGPGESGEGFIGHGALSPLRRGCVNRR